VIAELYTELVLDNRFALTANGTWGLRDYLKLEDVKKQYDYVDKFETTEEFDEMGGETTVFNDSEDTNENLNRISNKLSNDGLYDDDDDEEDEEDEEDDDDDFDDGLLEDSFDD
jgi:DNA-directed RNA polymerase subunit delta